MTKTYQIVLTGSSWGIRNTFYCFIAILISTLLVVTTICLRQDRGQLSQKINAPSDSSSSKCDLFSGKWVFDNESYPLYKEQQCTFMSDELACEKFGRKDLSYQNWRRKPHQYCDLPRSLFSLPIPHGKIIVWFLIDRHVFIILVNLYATLLISINEKELIQLLYIYTYLSISIYKKKKSITRHATISGSELYHNLFSPHNIFYFFSKYEAQTPMIFFIF